MCMFASCSALGWLNNACFLHSPANFVSRHFSAPACVLARRFCQQCGKFQPLSCFQGNRCVFTQCVVGEGVQAKTNASKQTLTSCTFGAGNTTRPSLQWQYCYSNCTLFKPHLITLHCLRCSLTQFAFMCVSPHALTLQAVLPNSPRAAQPAAAAAAHTQAPAWHQQQQQQGRRRQRKRWQ